MSLSSLGYPKKASVARAESNLKREAEGSAWCKLHMSSLVREGACLSVMDACHRIVVVKTLLTYPLYSILTAMQIDQV